MSFEKAGDPVTLVRSPMFTKLESGRIVTASRPLRRVKGSIVGIILGARPRTASAINLIWAGVVPQQPPTILSHPFSAHSRSWGARLSGVSGEPVGSNGFGNPAFGWAL